RAAVGTYAGYAIGNAWFYALGALLVLVTGAGADAVGIGGAIVFLAGGGLVLLALLVGESDNAFADIYSAAVSARNVAPSARQSRLILVVGAVGLGLALAFTVERYEVFLFLIGSVFVPLAAVLLVGAVGLVLALAFTVERYEVFLFLIGSVFVPLAAVLLADYFVHSRGRYGEAELFVRSGVRWRAFVPWVAGFVVYQWSVPTGPEGWVDALGDVFGALGLPFPLLDSRLGASIPSFAVAFVLAALLSRRTTRPPHA
ncbi:MAG TPA: hypothetical protein VJ913_03445, partial [Actinomycetota bacterium]|nr:hypothetical protein [Actinomycetota bacterium]